MSDYQLGWRDGWAAGRASMAPPPPVARAATIDDLPHGLGSDDDGLVVYVTREARDYRWCGPGLHWHPAPTPPCQAVEEEPTQPNRAALERLLGTTLEDWQYDWLANWRWDWLSGRFLPGEPSPRLAPDAPDTDATSGAGNGATGR